MDNHADPIARAIEAGERIEAIRAERNAEISDVAAERRAAVREARETMSAVEVAAALGISRARVYAIAAGRE